MTDDMKLALVLGVIFVLALFDWDGITRLRARRILKRNRFCPIHLKYYGLSSCITCRDIARDLGAQLAANRWAVKEQQIEWAKKVLTREVLGVLLFVGLAGSLFSAELPDVPTVDKSFIAVSAAVVSTSIADVETTRLVLSNGGTERNLFLGRHPTTLHLYTYTAMTDSLAIYTAYRLKKAHCKYWWVVPVAVGGSHIVGAFINWHVNSGLEPLHGTAQGASNVR